MPVDLSRISIRALSWVGAQCVRHYCAHRGIEDERVWAFCSYIEDLATTDDIPAWDDRGRKLQVSGLGDPLPGDLQSDRDLVLIVHHVHEISASQIHGAWQPSMAVSFVRAAATVAGYNLDDLRRVQILGAHEPGQDGWGDPIDDVTRESWREAADRRCCGRSPSCQQRR